MKILTLCSLGFFLPLLVIAVDTGKIPIQASRFPDAVPSAMYLLEFPLDLVITNNCPIFQIFQISHSVISSSRISTAELQDLHCHIFLSHLVLTFSLSAWIPCIIITIAPLHIPLFPWPFLPQPFLLDQFYPS